MMIRYLLFLALLALPMALYAQVDSDLGFFTIPEDKACAPYIPVITAPLCVGGGCTFFPDAGDATTARQLVSGQPIPDFEYQPGTWQMKVVIGNDPATQIIDFLTLTIAIIIATGGDTPRFSGSADRVRVHTREIEFDYPNWVWNAAWTKLQQGTIGAPYIFERGTNKDLLIDYYRATISASGVEDV